MRKIIFRNYRLSQSDLPNDEGRVLGLAMVPGQHVVSVSVESLNNSFNETQ